MNYYNVSLSLVQSGLFIMSDLGEILNIILKIIMVLNKFLTHSVGMK